MELSVSRQSVNMNRQINISKNANLKINKHKINNLS